MRLLAVYPTSSGMLYRKVLKTWWRREDSNLRHGAYETPALPPELRRRVGGPSSKLTGLRDRRQVTRPAGSRPEPVLGGPVPVTVPGSCGHVLKVGRAHDMVAVDHGPGPVPGDLHRHALGDPCIDHVPDRGPPEVVAKPMRRNLHLPGRKLDPLREAGLDPRRDPPLLRRLCALCLPGSPPIEDASRFTSGL